MTTGGPDESALGDPVEILLTEWARQCRSQGGLVVLPHFPNPRAEHAAGDRRAATSTRVEMTSWENLYSGIDPYSLSDWYRYLNCGYLVAAVGGTDKMAAATAVGTVRTYARIDPTQRIHLRGLEGGRPPRRDVRHLRPAARIHGGRPAHGEPDRHDRAGRHGRRGLAGRQRHRPDDARRAGGERRDPGERGGGARRGERALVGQGRPERVAGAAGARASAGQARDHRRALHAGDGDGRRDAGCWPPRTRSPSSTRSKARSPTWTRWAPAPRIGSTSGCGWCWNPPIAPCTTGCTSRGTTTSTRRLRRASMRSDTGRR